MVPAALAGVTVRAQGRKHLAIIGQAVQTEKSSIAGSESQYLHVCQFVCNNTS